MTDQAQSYPSRHRGTALILGSAPSLAADFKKAFSHHRAAAVFAVNEATQIHEPDFLASLHYERMREFDRLAMAAWPGRQWTTHCAIISERGCQPKDFPHIDYWWPDLWTPAATSAWFAVQVARKVGFSKFILCGCPMNGGDGYYRPTALSKERFGVLTDKHAYIKSVQDTIAMIAETDKADGVSSMSGFTREVFGQPEGI